MKKMRSMLAMLICLALLVGLTAVTAAAAGNTVSSTLDFATLPVDGTEDMTAAAEAIKGLGAVEASNLIIFDCHTKCVAGKGYAGPGYYVQKLDAGEGKVFAEAPVLTLNYRLANADPLGYIKVEGSIDGVTYYPFAELKEATGNSYAIEAKKSTTVTLEGGQGASSVWVKITVEHWGAPDAAAIDSSTITASVSGGETEQPEPELPENAVQSVVDMRNTDKIAVASGGELTGDAAKAEIERLGFIVPADSKAWKLKDCFHIFATPQEGYETCSVIQTLEAGEGKVFAEDISLTAGYWLAAVGDPSWFWVEVSTDGENWTEAYVDETGRGAEWQDSAYTEGTITLDGTAGASKVYVKFCVERHSGETAGGLTFSKLVGLTKAGTPSTPDTGDDVPETGDMIAVAIALLAISGTGIVVLKKKN